MLKLLSAFLLLASLTSVSMAEAYKGLCEYARVTKISSTAETISFALKEKFDESFYHQMDKKMAEDTKEICDSGSTIGLTDYMPCQRLCVQMGEGKTHTKLRKVTNGLVGLNKTTKDCIMFCQAHSLRLSAYKDAQDKSMSQSPDCNGNVTNTDRENNKSSLDNLSKSPKKTSSSASKE